MRKKPKITSTDLLFVIPPFWRLGTLLAIDAVLFRFTHLTRFSLGGSGWNHKRSRARIREKFRVTIHSLNLKSNRTTT